MSTHPTNPASSPLDTLRHCALRTLDLLDVAQDRLSWQAIDDTELVQDIIDSAKRELRLALGEHFGLGETLEDLIRPDPEAWRALLTYDDGSPVRITFTSHTADGGEVQHDRYPRIPDHRDPRRTA